MNVEHTTVGQLSEGQRFEAEVIVAMPAIDLAQAERSARLMARRAGESCLVVVVHDEERRGFVHAANLLFRQSASRYFVYTAQDAFAGRLWLRVAMHHMVRSGKSMLAFNDGKWHGLLASFGMVERQWALGNNYLDNLFFDGYHSHYADAELTLVARAQQQLCYAARSVMLEVDWEKDDKMVNDDDRKVYRERAAGLFDGRVPDEAHCKLFHQAAKTEEKALT